MFTVIDFETTGLDANESVVIEIGAIKLDHKLSIVKTYSTKVALPEGVVLPDFIKNLTGLTEDDLLGSPTADMAFASLKQFIGNSYIVAHNAPFDLSFLYKYLPDTEYEFIDTRAIIKLIEPEESAKLADVVKRYGITYENHHEALADCHMTVGVLKKLRQKLLRQNRSLLQYVNVAVDSEERPLTFIPPKANVVTLTK